MGSVDGSRVWGKDIKGPGLRGVQWSPDNSTLLFALSNGELHLYDDQGNFIVRINNKPCIIRYYEVSFRHISLYIFTSKTDRQLSS